MKFFLPLMLLTLTQMSYAKTFKIMQYNVENLFDTVHDEGTEDYTFLSLDTKAKIPNMRAICAKAGNPFYVKECLNLDWSERVLSSKLKNISQVIKKASPDIAVLEEVENVNVLGMLAPEYKHRVLIEGDDTRGIDVAVISKFPVISAKRSPIFFQGKKLNTRGILQVDINVDGQQITVFANHWPSQANPKTYRAEAAKLLEQLASDTKGSSLVIALGDFNTTQEDSPSPFKHLTKFIDSEEKAREVQTELNPGSHIYKGKWHSLDKIFVMKGSILKAQYNTFKIINDDFMLKRDRSGQMVPERFEPTSGEGFSDHLPLEMQISY